MDMMEDILMRYMISPEGANKYPFSVTPIDLVRSVITWATLTNQPRVPDEDLLLECLNVEYHRFVPAWLRVCSAISRGDFLVNDLSNTAAVPRDELARRIFNELENFKEPEFNVDELKAKRNEALPCLQRFLGDDDRYELQKFSDPDVLVLNAIWVQRNPIDPYRFDEVIELADKINDVMTLNFITTCPDQLAEELTQYAKENWGEFRRCLPRWLRAVEDAAKREGMSMMDDDQLRYLLSACGEPLVNSSQPINQMAAMKGIKSLAEDIQELRK